MDLFSAKPEETKSWVWSKFSAYLCFALASIILVTSLAAIARAKATGEDIDQASAPLLITAKPR